MKWSDIQFKPRNRIVRQFAAAWLVFLLACGAHQWIARGHHKTALVLGALGVGFGGLGLAVPPAIRWLYVSCMIVAFPIGWVLSQVLLAVMFYCVITPVAVFFRLRGRDLLGRKPGPERASFWTARTQPEDLRRYFRQY
jgi:saxitoxin biosynthesis operon SxtJ-like protein